MEAASLVKVNRKHVKLFSLTADKGGRFVDVLGVTGKKVGGGTGMMSGMNGRVSVGTGGRKIINRRIFSKQANNTSHRRVMEKKKGRELGKKKSKN